MQGWLWGQSHPSIPPSRTDGRVAIKRGSKPGRAALGGRVATSCLSATGKDLGVQQRALGPTWGRGDGGEGVDGSQGLFCCGGHVGTAPVATLTWIDEKCTLPVEQV